METLPWLASQFAITAIYQILFYCITVYFRFDKVTDLAGTTNFLLLAVIGLIKFQVKGQRALALSMMTCLWAIRLGIFLAIRVLVRRKDARFDKMRDDPVKLAGFWTLQALWVWIVSLPVSLSNHIDDMGKIDFVDKIGWTMWAIGFTIESVADLQRHHFNQQKSYRGRPFLDNGLWSYSRHPNYFGEILLWTGTSISAANGSAGLSRLACFLSPLATFLLLVFVSGIPLAEARDDKQHCDLMSYKQYKHRTSILIPLSPSYYENLPLWIKKWILLDFYQLAFFSPPRRPRRRSGLRSVGNNGEKKL